MSFRTLLVQADSDDRLMHRLSLAVSIARQHEARLIVVYVQREPVSLGMYSEPMGAPAVELIEQEIRTERERAEKLRETIDTMLKALHVEWEWRTSTGLPGEVLAATGAATDLIVMGQSQEVSATAPLAQVALSSGRPVLCIPYSGDFEAVGRRAVVAWHGTRESARALHDALPLLVKAEKVVLFTARDSVEGAGIDASSEDALKHLLAHGVKAELRHTALAGLDAGAAILNAVAEDSADLLVMGAYGHSRLRELVFGGATRTVLKSMTVPTLISH
jgi:nucleotide-binding universal stress UspA family protein